MKYTLTYLNRKGEWRNYTEGTLDEVLSDFYDLRDRAHFALTIRIEWERVDK